MVLILLALLFIFSSGNSRGGKNPSQTLKFVMSCQDLLTKPPEHKELHGLFWPLQSKPPGTESCMVCFHHCDPLHKGIKPYLLLDKLGVRPNFVVMIISGDKEDINTLTYWCVASVTYYFLEDQQSAKYWGFSVVGDPSTHINQKLIKRCICSI